MYDVTLENCELKNNLWRAVALFNMTYRESPDALFNPKGGHSGTHIPYSLRLTIHGCTVTASGPDGKLIGKPVPKTGGVPQQYTYSILKGGFQADNNTYWSPDAKDAFEIGNGPKREFADLPGWQKYTGQDARSTWKTPKR